MLDEPDVERTAGSADMAMLVVPGAAAVGVPEPSRSAAGDSGDMHPARFSTDRTAPPARIHRTIFQCQLSIFTSQSLPLRIASHRRYRHESATG